MSPTAIQAPSNTLRVLVDRYDPEVFMLARSSARVRLHGEELGDHDVLLDSDGGARLVPAEERRRADASLSADAETWQRIAEKAGEGLEAFRSGQLRLRHDLHLGVGFIAATSAGRTGLRFHHVSTERGQISVCEAGSGPPVLLVHGLGGTKASFLPTLAALAPHHRAISIDLPGFGDSVKPLLAPYDAPFFAKSMTALLDALELERVDVVGNSMGGRVALEMGLSTPERVRRLVLLAPSLAWLRSRQWAPLLRLVNPHLGLIQPAPRPIVEAIVRRVVPESQQRWTEAGIDEFLRSYLTARGRAAFYAAARNIYLEEPRGEDGFWTRLPELQAESLFVWGRLDPIVPRRFARHVRQALPYAEHLELRCGHVPQLEAPRPTHEAIVRFFAEA